MNINKGDKFLLTTDDWFMAPNGNMYRAVWGTVNGVLDAQSTLGIKTNAKSTNWYVSIGNMVVAGCQIHYAVKTDRVNFNNVNHALYSTEHGLNTVNRPTEIYNADE